MSSDIMQKIIFQVIMLLGLSCPFGNVQGAEAVGSIWFAGGTAQLQEMLDKVQDIQYTDLEIENRDGYVSVQIHNAREYRALRDWLDGPSGEAVVYLTMDMAETETCLYLDEILDGRNLRSLTIQNGGNISVKDMEKLGKYSLTSLELYHISILEADAVSCIQVDEDITIRLDDRYRGIMPTEELLDNRRSRNIILLWDGNMDAKGLIGKGESPFKDRKGEDILVQAAEKEKQRLNGIYRKNEDSYSYTGYEFVQGRDISDILISIEDKNSGGENYFDMLCVPQEKFPYRHESKGQRIWLEDVNFDGYEDLIFVGDMINNQYWASVVYLWEECTNRFKLCSSAPYYFNGIDDEGKRLTDTVCYESWGHCYIYEYLNGEFKEKGVQVWYTEYGDAIWMYYEEGELLEKLCLLSGRGEKQHYVYQGREGEMEIKEIPDDAEFDDIWKKFFPEFEIYF